MIRESFVNVRLLRPLTLVHKVGGDSRHLQEKYVFDFMRPLVESMVQDDPSKRPQMDEVLSQFTAICQSLSNSKLRSRVVNADDDPLDTPYRIRRISFILGRVPAVPSVLIMIGQCYFIVVCARSVVQC